MVAVEIDLGDRLHIVGHDEAADELSDVEICILSRLPGFVEMVEFGEAGLLVGAGRLHGLVVLLYFVTLDSQLPHALKSDGEVGDRLFDVLRGDRVQSPVVVEGSAVGLVIELEDNAAEGGLAAAALAH